MKMSVIYSSYLDDIERLETENEKLKKQLAEANDVLKTFHYSTDYTLISFEKITAYRKKWGVK